MSKSDREQREEVDGCRCEAVAPARGAEHAHAGDRSEAGPHAGGGTDQGGRRGHLPQADEPVSVQPSEVVNRGLSPAPIHHLPMRSSNMSMSGEPVDEIIDVEQFGKAGDVPPKGTEVPDPRGQAAGRIREGGRHWPARFSRLWARTPSASALIRSSRAERQRRSSPIRTWT